MPRQRARDADVVKIDTEMALQWSAINAPPARLSNYGGKRMFNAIRQAPKSDAKLAGLIDEVKEFANVYALARKRQKGCDGMGELATMKEEFRDVVDKVIQYCKEKEYISEVIDYDIDAIVDGIKRWE